MREPAEPRRRPRLQRWHWIVIVLLLPFVAGIVAVKIRRHGLEKEIARELAAIRARGEPVTPEELDAWYPKVPDAQNGALVITQAFAMASEIEKRGSENLSDLFKLTSQRTLSDESLIQVRQAVSAREPALRRLQTGLEGDSFRYPIEFTNGLFTTLPHLGRLRSAAQILALEARLAVADQRPDLAAERLANGLKLAETLENEPLLISFLVRSACLEITQEQAAHCLTIGTFDDRSLARLEKALVEDSSGTGFSRAMIGERSWGLSAFSMATNTAGLIQLGMLTGGAPGSGWAPESIKRWFEFYAYRGLATDAEDHLHYIRSMTAIIEAHRLPPEQRLSAVSNAMWNGISAPGTSRFLISQMMMPELERAALRDLKMLAGTRCFRTALTLERFRLGSGGTAPDSLDELVPKHLAAVPADPFTGQPLRYSRNGKGYVVYSIGENALDDHGDAKLDVAFIVEK